MWYVLAKMHISDLPEKVTEFWLLQQSRKIALEKSQDKFLLLNTTFSVPDMNSL